MPQTRAGRRAVTQGPAAMPSHHTRPGPRAETLGLGPQTRPRLDPNQLGRAKSLLIDLPIAAAQSSSLELRAAKNRQTTHAGFGLLSRTPPLLGWWVKSPRPRRPRGRPPRHRRADQHPQLEL